MQLTKIWQLSYESKTIDILRDSHHAIPIIQAFHLFGITLLLGAMVILDFRMLGIGMTGFPLRVLARHVWSWGSAGLVLSIVSGLLVFIPDPARYAANRSFVFKMSLLLLTILFQYSLYRRAVRTVVELDSARPSKVIPVLSLFLWFGIGWAGRAIAFLG